MSQHVLVGLDAGVLGSEMRRPQKKNALTGPMYAAMADALGRAAREDEVRLVLILGQCEAFTAGNDLGDFLDGPAASLRQAKRLLKQSITALIPQAMQEEGETCRRLLASAEAREAFRAFLEKRQPDFSESA